MIWNLGSINLDNYYDVPHLPVPGETLAATRHAQGLGGKGANQSIAAARAAAHVSHVGAIGPDGDWIIERLVEYGVHVSHIARVKEATGHASVFVDEKGENCIVIVPGSNAVVTESLIGTALTEASPGDFLLMQNETNGQQFAAETAKTLGLKVAYAAAPFDARAVAKVIDKLDLLVLNTVEAAQLSEKTGRDIKALGVPDIVVTLGAVGCKWVSKKGEKVYPAYPANPVDTTGAGDTFTGYLVAALDRGIDMEGAIDLALKAGALMVGRRGTGDVIPDLKEVLEAFD